MASPAINLVDRVLAFSMEASTELSQQQDLLGMVKKDGERKFRKTVIPLALILLASVLMFVHPEALFIWFIVSLFLYSYNFLFLLLPTTSKRSRPKRNGFNGRPGSAHKVEALKLLLRKKRKLAVEMGLTLYLGRMVPLTISFTIILGLGMSILVYFIQTSYTAADGLTWLIIVQATLIMIFYLFVNIIRPQTQGISALARAWKRRMGVARFRGRLATVLVRLTALGLISTSVILFIGAMVLPGVTFVALLSSVSVITPIDLVMFAVMFVIQMWVMRSFQSLMSRRMAIKLLHIRIDKLQQLLINAERLNSSKGPEIDRTEELQELLTEYYSMMVYDIFRLDFFGRAPVYLVGPRFKYLMDEKALQHMEC
jgi:hypothetical protein